MSLFLLDHRLWMPRNHLGSLIAQRDMYDAKRARIATRLAKAVSLVQLYQALGSGWKE
jgi:outer membrane protein TolC